MKDMDNKGSSTQVKCDALNSESDTTFDESDTLSDIEDFEVMGYLHNEDESHSKKITWERIPTNRKYMQEQAAKEAAVHKLYTGTSEEIREAQELASKKHEPLVEKIDGSSAKGEEIVNEDDEYNEHQISERYVDDYDQDY